ncbi:MAG: polymer-forming cytoskeletal protein [Pseudomonadota bacterium]|nr:polymer-forming cytoskeletal protein [Pseudomonadota bacterium]
MNNPAWLALLVLANAALLLLPMLPALVEWRRTAARPLHIPDDDEAGIEYFAARFRQHLIEDWHGHPFFLAPEPGPSMTATPALEGALAPVPAGLVGSYRIAAPGIPVVGRDRAGRTLEPVLVGGDLLLAEGNDYLGDIYARTRLRSPGGCVIRAVLCDGDVELGPGSGILRWAHARNLRIGAGSRVPGRLSALESVSLGTDCRFQRVKAPVIDTGPGRDWPEVPAPICKDAQPRDADAATEPGALQWQPHSARWTCDGDTMLPPGCVVDGDLIVRGNLQLGAGCVIHGSIKAYRDVEIGPESQVLGSCFSRGRIRVRRDTRILGQLSSIAAISFEDGCMVGRPGRPASTIAPDISIKGTCRFHGSLWARDNGWIRAP